ncbi:MAG: glutamate racemase [Rhodobacteraceae bacterium]|nr:glutamate racemase [Paracoccaceae bacterium]
MTAALPTGKHSEQPVVIFDSGIGGLTVLREVRFKLPFDRLVYVFDDAGFPYGDWDEQPLLDRIVALIGKVIEAHDPKAIIIACNTAFTLAGEALRKTYPNVPFVGTVPAIKPAAARTKSGLISVLATPGTVQRAYTRDLIEAHASGCSVTLVGSQKLAQLAEGHLRGQQVTDEALLAEIEGCFVASDGRRTDIVVLACTHYPFLTNRLREVAPWPVDWIDPAEAIARQLGRVVSASSAPEQGAEINSDEVMCSSGNLSGESLSLMRGFGLVFTGQLPT